MPTSVVVVCDRLGLFISKKKKKNQEGGKHLFTALYVYLGIYLYIEIDIDISPNCKKKKKRQAGCCDNVCLNMYFRKF